MKNKLLSPNIENGFVHNVLQQNMASEPNEFLRNCFLNSILFYLHGVGRNTNGCEVRFLK